MSAPCEGELTTPMPARAALPQTNCPVPGDGDAASPNGHANETLPPVTPAHETTARRGQWWNNERIRRSAAMLRAWFARNTFAPDWLPPRWRHPAMGYPLAVLLQALSVAIAIPFLAALPNFRVTGLLEMLAILLAAFFWGAGPSLVSTLVGVVFFDLVALAPPFPLSPHPVAKLVELALFVAVGSAISVLASQQERARQQAVAAQTEMEAVFVTVPDRLTLFDAQGTILRLNPAAQELAGPDRGHEGLAEMQQAYGLLTPEGAAYPTDQLPVARALRGETVAGMELRLGTAQGREEIIIVAAAPLRAPDGTVRGAVALSHDVTQLRRAEQDASARARQMEATFDAMGDGVVVYDADGRILHVNASLRHTLALDAHPDYAAMSADERALLIAPRDAQDEPLPREIWPHVRLLRGETLDGERAVEARLRNLAGRELVVSYTGAPLRDDQGQVTGAVMVIRDLTERKRLERDVAEHASELEAIQTVTDAALAHLSLDVMLRELLERLLSVLAVDNVAILLPDAAMSELHIYAARGPEEEVARQVRVPMGEGVAGRIAATRQPLVIDDLRNATVANLFLHERLRSLVGVPLLVEDRLIGVMHAATAHPHHFTGPEVHLLQVVADRIALAIERAQLHQQAQQARQEAVEHASQIYATIQSIADGVVVFDRDGRLIQMNEMAQRLLGIAAQPEYTPQPLAGSRRQVRDATGQPLPPHDWPVNRVLRGEVITGARTVDLMIQTADGRDILVGVSGAPVHDSAGNVLGAVCVFRDVTEQRRLAQRTHDALAALLAMAAALVELPAEPLAASGLATPAGAPAAEAVAQHLARLTRDVLGCQRVGLVAIEPETLLQRPIAVVGLAPDQESQWWAEQLAHPARYGEGTDPDLLARFETGEAMALNMTEPPYAALPNPYGITTVLVAPMRVGTQMIGILSLDFGGPPHAFTEQERALAAAVAQLAALVIERDRLLREREVARANELAAHEVTRRYDQFLGIAGHELKTPVTVIKANLQLTARQVRKAQEDTRVTGELAESLLAANRMLDRQERGLARLTRLIDDLLDVSRIREGKLELHLEPCDLLSLVRDRLEEQRQLNPKRTLRLSVVPANMDAIPLVADADRIGQVVTNYLTNALKYSPADQPVRAVVAREAAAVRVSVYDEGPGLPPAEQARIWEPFHRAKGIEVMTGSGVGLGLGLHISKTLIERHGGEVGIESAPGHGSTFWFTLPLPE